MILENMAQERALRRLPAAYAVALRLRAAAVSDELIAECLGVEAAALGPLLQIADAKLAAMIGAEADRPPVR